MKKLDKSRPYGEVHGLGNREKYEQDGVYFDAHGVEIMVEVKGEFVCSCGRDFPTKQGLTMHQRHNQCQQ